MLGPAGMMTARDASGVFAPADPSNLVAQQTSETSIRVTWTDNATNEDEYRLYRQVDGGGYVLYQTLAKDDEDYDDTGLTTGSTYDYKIAAANEVGESTQVGPASVTLAPDIPAAPTGLSATTVSASRIDLSWTDNADNEDNYVIYRDGVLFDTIAANSTSYSATGLAEGTEYDWKVGAKNSSGTAFSSTVSQYTKLAQPTNLSANNDLGFTRLTWQDNSSKEQNYEVYRDGSLYATIAANSEQYDIGCPDADATWKVRAIHSVIPDSFDSNGVLGATC